MQTHRYSVGQTVRMTGWSRISSYSARTYRVVATLPEQDNVLQYRIRSDDERHERVTSEDNLEKVDTPSFWKTA
ncbi:hypothetical protein [Roseibium sp.]|uniref:hypothetical protein n=1 Tax=Roseibium sp. TaxID=1936156 RepID=UPI003A97647F